MKHIPEIDGLRAVAVVPVILYHVQVREASGGFIGVDVFFVISGYLITGILLADLDKEQLSIARFYTRRVLRIVPALFVTLAATAFVFFSIFPPISAPELFASLAAAVFSYSNFWFYATIDYFADMVTNPVLHTWSLGVEEQFYFVFPLLLLLIAKAGQRAALPAILSGLCLLSFGLCVLATSENQAQAFYFSWLRAWELLLGSLLAIAPLHAIPTRAKEVLCAVGLVMIATAVVAYTDRMAYPGYLALVPCVGAAAVIAGANADSLANRALRIAPVRWTGQISYSLYLIHWPLVCLAALLVTLHPKSVKLAVITLTFLLAWLSWRFVERPFREKAGRISPRRVLTAFAAGAVALVPFFAMFQFLSTHLWERHPQALRYSEFLKIDTSFFRLGTCFLTERHGLPSLAGDTCLKQRAGFNNVLVLGDSHAANISVGLAERYTSWNVLQATAVDCRPLLHARRPAHCSALLEHMFHDWLPNTGAQVRHVVLAGRWENGDIESLKKTIAYLRKLGKNVILYGPSPEYYVSVPLILAYEQRFGIKIGDRLFKHERRRLNSRLKSIFLENTSYFSPMDSLCDAHRCKLLDGGVPTFFDRDHFTPAGVKLVLEGFPLH